MPEVKIESLVNLLRQSIGIEAAEKFINEAIAEKGLSRKTSYSEAEFDKMAPELTPEERGRLRAGFLCEKAVSIEFPSGAKCIVML